MTITNVIIKILDMKWDWGMNDVMSGSDGLRIWWFRKRCFNSGPGQSSWGVLTVDDVGDSWFVCLNCRQLKLKSDHGVLEISTDRDLGGYRMRSAFVGSDSTVSIVKICVSLSSCRKTKVKKVNKCFIPEQQKVISVSYFAAPVYFTNTVTLKILILQLSMKCLSV